LFDGNVWPSGLKPSETRFCAFRSRLRSGLAGAKDGRRVPKKIFDHFCRGLNVRWRLSGVVSHAGNSRSRRNRSSIALRSAAVNVRGFDAAPNLWPLSARRFHLVSGWPP
jgi:hypothetical protein